MRSADSDDYLSPEEEEPSDTGIADFFIDRSVFITGVTGFVGKVLLEKLLRSCPRVKTVYVLLRPKDNQDARQRLDDLLTCKIFSRLRREQPTSLTKVVPIAGDISLKELGINQSDAKVLEKNVSVVFHSAATVRFDEPVRKSVELNICGTKRVLDLSKKMVKLAAIVHVSTAYSYCNHRDIDEVIYPDKIRPQKVMDFVDWMDDSVLQTLESTLLDGRPTTYHWSKALAENLLQQEADGSPIAIVRPSIVTAAYKEPIPGWVDGLNGPSTFIIMTGKGLLRTMLVYEGSVVDWFPVDLLANVILTAAWHLGMHRPKGVQVYNCTSGERNRITWSDIERTAYPLIIRHPSNKVIRYPGGSFKKSPFLNSLSLYFEHALPAYLIDGLRSLTGQPAKYVAMVQRMKRAATYLQYFTTNQWIFRSSNFLHLMEMQSPKDKQVFNMDVAPIEWTPYLENYVLGVRKFILKEDETTLRAARRKISRLYYAELLGRWGSILAMIYLLMTRTRLSHYLFWAFMNIAFKIIQKLPPSWLNYVSSKFF